MTLPTPSTEILNTAKSCWSRLLLGLAIVGFVILVMVHTGRSDNPGGGCTTGASISSGPSDQTVCAGNVATLTVSAGGCSPSFQWFKNNASISGATSSTLVFNPVSTADAGSYYVNVYNDYGRTDSPPAQLTVNPKPTVTVSPIAPVICQGASVALTASGASTYVWSPATGLNTNAGETVVASPSSNTTYTVAGTSTNGCQNTTNVTVTVLPPPSITTSPTNWIACTGASAVFSVSASGSLLSYQWRKNGEDISDATSSTLTLNNVSSLDASNYSVVVSNSCGSTNSAAASLTVLAPPSITSQPVSRTNCLGETASFSVSATGATTYQWRKNGVNLGNGGNVSGANTNTLTISNIFINDAGSYTVIVANSCGAQTSTVATLTAKICDGIPDWWKLQYGFSLDDPYVAGADPDNDGYTNLQEYHLGADPTNSVSHPTTIPPYLVGWWKLDEGTGTHIADSSTNDHSGVLQGNAPSNCWITGVLSNALSFDGITPNWVEISWSPYSSLTPTQSLTVAGWVKVSNAEGEAVLVGSLDSEWSEWNYALWVQANYAVFSFHLNDGYDIYGSAQISSNDWHHLAAVYTGSNVSLYVDGNLSTNQNITGQLAMFHTPLLIGFPGQPACSVDDVRIYRRALSASDILALYNEGSCNPSNIVLSVPSSVCAGSTGNHAVGPYFGPATSNVWSIANGTITAVQGTTNITWTAGTSGTATVCLTVVFSPVCSNTGCAIVTINPPPTVTASNNGPICAGQTLQLFASEVTGGTYHWIGPNGFSTSAQNPIISNAPPTASGIYSVTATGTNGCTSAPTTTFATVYAKPTATLSGSATICLGQPATVQADVTGNNPWIVTWSDGVITTNYSSPASRTITPTFTTNFTVISVSDSNCVAGTSSGSFTINVNIAPAVALSPTNWTVCAGNTAVFTALASGTPTPTVQWQVSTNGGASFFNITGATSTTLGFTTSTSDNNRKYRAVFSNSCGTNNSAAATLTVNTPVITSQPVDQTVTYGENATFSVGAFGNGALTYQWRKNGANISGANLTSYTITNPPVSDSGNRFDVVITYGGCSVTSSSALLTVNRKLLTVTAISTNREYGVPNPTFSHTFNGFVSGEDTNVLTGVPELSTIANAGSSIGSYPITPAIGSLSAANYSFTFVNGQLTITKANLNVTADNKVRFVGEENPPLTGVITGLRNGDPISATYFTWATIQSNVGNYAIIPSWVDPAEKLPNYVSTITTGILTITNAPVVIHIASTNVEYMLGRPATPLSAAATISFSGSVPNNYFSGKKLRVAFLQSRDKDYVAVRNSTTNKLVVALNAAGSAYNITNNGTFVGSYTGGTPTQAMVVTFSSNALTNHVQTILQNVSYYNTASSPSFSESKISMRFDETNDVPISAESVFTERPFCPACIDTVLVIDKTGSMSNTDVYDGVVLTNRITVAKKAATNFVGFLSLPDSGPPTDGVSVVAFPQTGTSSFASASTVTNMTFNPTFATNFSAAISGITSIPTPSGATVYAPVLGQVHTNYTTKYGGASQTYSSSVLQVVLFMTDGMMLESSVDGCNRTNWTCYEGYRTNAINAARLLTEKGARVITIGFAGSFDTEGTNLLQEIASAKDDCLIAPTQDALNSKYIDTASGVCRGNFLFSTNLLTYLEKTAATRIDTNFFVHVPGSLSNRVITVRLTPNNLEEDQLAISNAGPAGIHFEGNVVKYGTTNIGTVVFSQSTITVTLSNTATSVAVAEMMRHITYYNSSIDPTGIVRKVTAQLTGSTTNVAVSTEMYIQVLPVNDAPTLDPIQDMTVIAGAGPNVVDLTGITTGGETSQSILSVNAVAENNELITSITTAYSPNQTNGTVSFFAGPTGIAHITVTVLDNGGTANGGINFINWTFAVTNIPATPPAVSLSPTNPAVCSGSTVTLNAVVSGTGPFSYMWRHNSAELTETGGSLSIANVSPEDAGNYSVEVTTPYGAATESANLIVLTHVEATALTNLALCVGSKAIFTVNASGSGPLNYTWIQNGDVLAGQASPSLALNNLTPWDAGTITVIVDGACGSVTNNATLIVGNTPFANSQSLSTQRGILLPIILTGSDPAGTPLTYSVLSGPSHGNLSSQSGSNLTYTPAVGFVGTDSFIFMVSNGTCDSAPATVSIEVLDDYWVLFFNTLGCFEGPPDLSLMITAFTPATGTISYVVNGVASSQSFSVNPGVVTTIPISISMMITNYDTNTSQAIHVTANHPVSISTLNYAMAYSEASAVLPTSMLGTNYYLMARPSFWVPTSCLSGWWNPFDPHTMRSQFAILATESGTTTVIVTPSPYAHIEGHETAFTNHLSQGETYQLRSTYMVTFGSNDVSGTFITSDKPISVVAGASLAYVPYADNDINEAATSPLIEAQFPTRLWGTKVPSAPLATIGKPTYYRAVVANDNTAVFTNGTLWTSLNKGEFADAVFREPILFQGSNGLIQVAQFTGDRCFDMWNPMTYQSWPPDYTICCEEWGSSSELLMLPVGQFQNSYTVATPAGFGTNFLNVIVERYAIPTTEIDGKSIPRWRFRAIGDSGYSGAQIPVSPGAHIATSSRPFGLQAYGYAYKRTYTFNAISPNQSNVTVFAVSDVVSVPAGGSSIDVLSNDLFVSRSDVIVTNVSTPSHGSVAVTPSKTVSYTPTGGYFGEDHFTYQIMEQGIVSSAPVTVWITNHPPVAVDHSNVVVCTTYFGDGRTPLLREGSLIHVLDGAYSPDGYALSIESVGGPTNGTTSGTLVINQSDAVTYWNYDPASADEILGPDSFTYTITDGHGGTAQATVYLFADRVSAYSGTANVCGNQPVTIGVPAGSGSVIGGTLTFVSVSQGNLGAVSIDPGGQTVRYTPSPAFTNSDVFSFTITDGYCTDSGAIIVSAYNPCTNWIVYGDANCYGLMPVLTNGSCNGANVVQSIEPGVSLTHGLTNVDIITSIGEISSTCTVTLTVLCTNGTPVALLTSPSSLGADPSDPLRSIELPIVTDGLLVVSGRVYQANALSSNVQYKVVITDDQEAPILDSGWFPPATFHPNEHLINTNDLTSLADGMYIIHLIADNISASATSTVSFLLNSSLKVGRFSFSQQDVVIPVNGIPITVTRTYDSFNAKNFNPARSNDFGAGWTYALNDLQVELNEERGYFYNTDDDKWDSLRIGGGRDVTLTLPDGRRATFALRHKYNTVINDNPVAVFKWQAPPGVNYTLEPTASSNLVLQVGVSPFWEGGNYGGPSAEANYDFPGFVLTASDGTRFEINRESFGVNNYVTEEWQSFVAHPYGPPKLARIVLRDGSSLSFSESGVTHSSGKTIRFHRDEEGRIDAVYDPESLDGSGNPNGPPAVAYVYNGDNLVAVSNLVSRSPLQYNVTRYIYGSGTLSHYITEIKDPRGITPIKNLYDNQGRLIGVVDAFGRTNSFSHDVANRTEIVTDRLGNQTIHVYDTRGNVVKTIDAFGNATERTYDGNNNMLSESNAVGKTTYAYEGYNRTMVIDPLGHTNSFIYDSYGNMLTHTDALNRVTRNFYDDGNHLTATIDPAGNITSNVYDAAGNRIDEYQMDSNLTVLSHTHYDYDQYGNLTNVTDAAGHNTGYTYDNNGNQLTETTTTNVNNTGATLVTTHIYDGQNRLVKTIDPLGYTNEMVFNAIGKQEKLIDKSGRATFYEYDDMGRLTKVTYPDYTFERYGYDAEGRRTTSIDRGYHTTTTTYDALGRQILAIYPDGATISNTYDSVGRLVATTDARTNTTLYGYDAAGRRTSITNALQQVTRFDYDAAGNLINTIDALSRTVSNVYDNLGRRIKVVYPDNTVQETKYDLLGRRIAEIDQAGITNWFGYDVLGRLTSVTNALGKVTRYEYDALGNLLLQIDANNHTNRFVYDKLGRRIYRTLPLGMTETNFYDAVGNLVTNFDFNGRKTVFEYDAMNRLTRKTPDVALQESPVIFTYYTTGQRSMMVDASGTTSYTYDALNRLKTKTTPVGTITYDYDFAGNLTKIQSSTPNGTLVSYQYDALNRLTNAVDSRLSGNQNTRYGYDAVGNLLTNIYPNAVTNLFRYASLNRLTNVTAKAGSTTLGSFAYLVGVAGNRTNLSEAVNGVSRNYAWTYDSLYRLTNEVISASPAGTISYKYDSVGNRTNRTSSVASVPSAVYSYDSNDRLTADLYDANGNTTNSTGNSYRYNFENRLINFKNRGAVYTYDGDGNRVSKEVGATVTLYLVDEKNPTGYAQVLEEFTATVGGTTNLARAYTYGLDLINQRAFDGTVRFYGYDGHGSIRFLTSTNAVVTDTYTYDAFGSMIASNVATANVYLYTGEQFDTDLGLYYLRARHMNPGTGRFWTRDTFEGNSSDPLSLHKYLYAGDDPVNRIDPSGREFSLNEMQIATFISVTINAFSAAANIRAKRYGWAAVDIMSMGLGIFGGFGGPGLFKELATASGVVVTTAGLQAGITGAQEACQAWALVDLVMMMSQSNGGDPLEQFESAQGNVKPSVPNNIPASTEASVTDKLQRYLLNFNHPIGGPKAKFFKDALGFDLSNAGNLAKQIVFDEAKARPTQLTEYGQKFEQTIKVTGANGRNIDVLFVWIRNKDGVVRLVTSVPNTL